MKPRVTETVLTDPGQRFGNFRVMRRTDGRGIVVDERRPLGERTVYVSPAESKQPVIDAIIDAKNRHGRE